MLRCAAPTTNGNVVARYENVNAVELIEEAFKTSVGVSKAINRHRVVSPSKWRYMNVEPTHIGQIQTIPRSYPRLRQMLEYLVTENDIKVARKVQVVCAYIRRNGARDFRHSG
jgi:hypothetical protein